MSCAGRADLTREELEKVVPTAERLHHAGGEFLQSKEEVELDVNMGGTLVKVTFNVIETGRFNLGFLLRMDVLEKHGFLLNAITRSVDFLNHVMSPEKP